MYISDGKSIVNINDELLCVGKDAEEREQQELCYYWVYYLVIFYKNQQPIKLVYSEKEERDCIYNQLISILDIMDNLKYERSDK